MHKENNRSGVDSILKSFHGSLAYALGSTNKKVVVEYNNGNSAPKIYVTNIHDKGTLIDYCKALQGKAESIGLKFDPEGIYIDPKKVKELSLNFYSQKKKKSFLKEKDPRQIGMSLGNILDPKRKNLPPLIANPPTEDISTEFFIHRGGNEDALYEAKEIIDRFKKGETLDNYLYLLEGPNGSGKTHLFNHLMMQLKEGEEGIIPRYLDVYKNLVAFNKQDPSSATENQMMELLKKAKIGFIDSINLLINRGSREYRYGAGNNLYDIIEFAKEKSHLLFLACATNALDVDSVLTAIKEAKNGNPDLADRIDNADRIELFYPLSGERPKFIRNLLSTDRGFEGKNLEKIAEGIDKAIPPGKSIRVLQRVIRKHKKDLTKQSRLFEDVAEKILEALGNLHPDLSTAEIIGPSRRKDILELRQLGAWAIEELTGYSDEMIGKYLGGRKAKTVKKLREQIKERLDQRQLELCLKKLEDKMT